MSFFWIDYQFLSIFRPLLHHSKTTNSTPTDGERKDDTAADQSNDIANIKKQKSWKREENR